MRISTNQIYDAGTLGIQRNQSALLKLQQQISSETKILTAADDPIGASQALVVTQSLEVNAQQQTNQDSATSRLSLVDAQLGSLTTLLQNVRDNVVRAGGGSLTNADRAAIASTLESNLSELVGIANSDDGTGDYLFSGYKGTTLPFAVSGDDAIAPATSSPIAYSGDDGERLLQVSSSRQIAVSVSGSELFMKARNGNGFFVATTGGSPISAYSSNTGTVSATDVVVDQTVWDASVASGAVPLVISFTSATSYDIKDSSGSTVGSGTYTSPETISLSVGVTVELTGTPVVGDSFKIDDNVNQGSATISTGSVTDMQQWKDSVADPTSALPLTISFEDDGAGGLNYKITDADGVSTTAAAFSSGQSISLKTGSGLDYGSQVTISGTPAIGDTFTVTPSSAQSTFQTLQNLIGILQTSVGDTTYTNTQLANDLALQLSNLDQSMSQVSRIQSAIGTSMNEVDSLASTSADLKIQYSSTLSNIQDLDYAEALSDFSLQQVALEAAQKSFVTISGLSLFDYL